jgi:hypothetical protein
MARCCLPLHDPDLDHRPHLQRHSSVRAGSRPRESGFTGKWFRVAYKLNRAHTKELRGTLPCARESSRVSPQVRFYGKRHRVR